MGSRCTDPEFAYPSRWDQPRRRANASGVTTRAGLRDCEPGCPVRPLTVPPARASLARAVATPQVCADRGWPVCRSPVSSPAACRQRAPIECTDTFVSANGPIRQGVDLGR